MRRASPKQEIRTSAAQGDLRALVRLLAVQAAREFVASGLTEQPGEVHVQSSRTPPDEPRAAHDDS